MHYCTMTACTSAYMLAPMNEHWSRQYVRHTAKELGVTLTRLATMCGLSSTTLTRPLNNPAHKHDIGRDTLDKIALKTGIPYAAFQSAGEAQIRDGLDAIDSFPTRLANLPSYRQARVLQYLAEQEILDAQENQSRNRDDQG